MASEYPRRRRELRRVQVLHRAPPSESPPFVGPTWNWRRSEFHVHRAIVQGVEKATTKTNTARMVLLNSRAMAAVMRQRSLTQLAGDFVFVDPRYGTPWLDERAFRCSYWTPTLTALCLRYRKPYNTRHSYATMMLMAGMTPAFCGAQLGHSVGMLLSTYAPEAGRRAQRAGDATAGGRARQGFIPEFVPGAGPSDAARRAQLTSDRSRSRECSGGGSSAGDLSRTPPSAALSCPSFVDVFFGVADGTPNPRRRITILDSTN